MQNLKKIIYSLLLGLIVLSLHGISYAFDQLPGQTTEDFYYGSQYEVASEGNEDNIKRPKIIQTETLRTNDSSLLYKIRGIFRLTGKSYYDNPKPATGYITMIMNMALGLVSFVSLILIIYSFYLIFFQKGEEAFAKAKKILIGVAMAIVFIGLSWVIVNTFFIVSQTEAIRNLP
jgi:hypothetical protein